MVLDKEALSILRYIYRQKTVTYGELKRKFPNKPVFELVSTLASEKAIEYESVTRRSQTGQLGPFLYDDAKISCTSHGKKYIEDFLECKKEKRIEAIRYWITTAIAVAAFIKSFFF